MTRRAILAVVALCTLSAHAARGAETAQTYGFRPDSFEIKFYMQPRFTWVAEPDKAVDNTFGIRRGRIYVTSKVAPHVQGRIQFEVKPEKTEALDVYFTWTNPPETGLPVNVTVGQFKKPFSYQELIMSSANLNLIDRTVANTFLEKTLLVSSRDQGAMAILDLWEKNVPGMLYLGAFNGNGLNKKEDDNSGKQFAGRADFTPITGFSLAADGVVSRVSRADTSGTFTVWGADGVYAKSGFQAVAEVFGGDNFAGVLTKTVAPSADVPSFLAYYAEAIYRFPSGWEPAARAERFDPNTDADDDEQTIFTGQIARTFSPNFRWQVNVIHTSFADDAKDAETSLVSQWTVRL